MAPRSTHFSECVDHRIGNPASEPGTCEIPRARVGLTRMLKVEKRSALAWQAGPRQQASGASRGSL